MATVPPSDGRSREQRAKRSRHPWEQIRAAYVEGRAVNEDGDPNRRDWPTLDEVAVMFDVHDRNVKARAASEHWLDRRKEYQADLERERRRRLMDSRVEATTRIDSSALTSAEAGLTLVGLRLQRLVTVESNTAPSERGRVEGSEMAALGLAARRWLQVKAAVMGQPAFLEPTADELEQSLQVSDALVAAKLAAWIAEQASADVDADA